MKNVIKVLGKVKVNKSWHIEMLLLYKTLKGEKT